MEGAKKKKPVAKKKPTMIDTLLTAAKQEVRIRKKSPEIVIDGVVVKMPLEIILSRADFTALQLKIITSVMAKIGEKVLDELTKKKNIVSLFTAEEFGEDPKKIRFIIYEREFPNYEHKKELEEALLLMRVVPIDIPVKGNLTGNVYTTYTNLCSITIPEGQNDNNKYCIVTMEREVADHIINEDSIFANILAAANKKMRSKYSIRMYWFTRAYSYSDERTFSFEYLFDMFCKDVDKMRKYSVFEELLLRKPKQDLDKLFEEGIIDYRFEYYPTLEEHKKSKSRENPKEIVFRFFRTKELPKEESKTIPLAPLTVSSVEKKIAEDFMLTPKAAHDIASKLTMENIEAFDRKVASVIEAIESGKVKKEKIGGYAYRAFNNFFMEFAGGFSKYEDVSEKESSETEQPPTNYAEYEVIEEMDAAINWTSNTENVSMKSKDSNSSSPMGQEHWRAQWYKCKTLMEHYGYTLASQASHLMNFKSYDEKSKVLIIQVPGPTIEVQELIERNLSKLIMWHVLQFFPSDTTIEYEIVKFVQRSDEDAKQQLRSLLEQHKLYGIDVMDVRSPLFNPRDRKGMPIPEEVWKWNYVMTVISKKVSEQEFRDVFSNLKLISYKSNIESSCHHITELIVQIPSREFYDVLESPEYVALLQEPLRYIFNEFKLMYKLPPVS